MNNGDQLTFSDDKTVESVNRGLDFLENGDFMNAFSVFDSIMNNKPDYPGVEAGYRTSRYWLNRVPGLATLNNGKESADFLMSQWNEFENYSREKNFFGGSAFKAVQKYIYYNSSEHYKTAFANQESPADNFSLLMNLAVCFLTLEDYPKTIETLEYAKSFFKNDPKLLSILAAAYFKTGEAPKSLLLFREAFFINPSAIDIELIKCEPINELTSASKEAHPDEDIREWVPVYGFLMDIFYVKGKISQQTAELITKDIASLEKSYQSMTREKLKKSNVLPRLINKYLWLYDYYHFQNYDLSILSQISQRLIEIDKSLFGSYFSKNKP